MSHQLTFQPASSRQHRYRCLLALAITLVVALPSAVQARTNASALLELDMTIPSGAITNKFGFATSFPKPEDAPGIGINNGNPGGERSTFTQNGGSATLGPNRPEDGIKRNSIPKGRGMKLYLDEYTNAMPVDGSIGQAEGWLSGTTKFRLGNFTGRPGLPEPAENLKVDLDVQMLYDLIASASNDIVIVDQANAKLVYSLINTTTGDILIPETVIRVDDDDVRPDDRKMSPKANIPTPQITLPSNSFHNLELFGHIYVAGESRGSAPPNPPPVNRPPGSIPNLPERMDQPLPDDDMRLPLASLALFGDALGHGGGVLQASAGVVGEAPEARHGLNTVMLNNTITSGDSFFDVEVAIEVPVNDFSQVAIQDVMGAASGFHGQFFDLQVGTGVGDEFQLSQNPGFLSLAGSESAFPSQDLTWAYQLMDFNDPFNPTQMLFQGELQPGQLSQFEHVANLHDLIDGEIDGMARFTMRKFVEGFGGDYNNDFVTDGTDLALWQQTYGTEDFLADGDANGYIGGGDFLNWQRNVGRGFEIPGGTSPAAFSAVPEPVSVTLALVGMIAIASGQRHVRKV